MHAVLRSLNPELLTVIDSTAEFGTVSPGAAAAVQTPFRVRASARTGARKTVLTPSASQKSC